MAPALTVPHDRDGGAVAPEMRLLLGVDEFHGAPPRATGEAACSSMYRSMIRLTSSPTVTPRSFAVLSK